MSETWSESVFWAFLSGCGGRKCGHGVKPLQGFSTLIGPYHISKGHQDLSLSTSQAPLLRRAADWRHPESGEPFSTEDICRAIVCLLYVSSESSTAGVSNTILDLASNPEAYHKFREETGPILRAGRLDALVKDAYVHACVLESARMNVTALPVNREIKNKKHIGDYYIGDADVIAVCAEVLHNKKRAGDRFFDNPTDFRPERFLSSENGTKMMNPMVLMSWGAGLHICPGRNLAQMEIKIGVAVLLEHVDIDLPNIEIMGPTLFSNAALYQRDHKLNIKW
ncbi:putative lanosterol 14-alpha demethylase [Folsomia candida]|uniref:Putative lanosterol 14-alpha demethylase n=1 Tax=Folsomia candida TaxID=158441 RepID=A0A226DYS2_FOLCA|nr:putative lanosterol 14-alpha demethylase [Folsomia candida]